MLNSVQNLLAVLYVLAGCATHAGAADQETHFNGGVPEVGIAVMTDGRTLELRRFAERFITRTTTNPGAPAVVVKAGTIVPQTTTEVVPVVETMTTKIDVNSIGARRIDGRAVAPQALVKELAQPIPIILVKGGQPLDPIFARLFKAETLVLTLPTSSATSFGTAPVLRPK